MNYQQPSNTMPPISDLPSTTPRSTCNNKNNNFSYDHNMMKNKNGYYEQSHYYPNTQKRCVSSGMAYECNNNNNMNGNNSDINNLNRNWEMLQNSFDDSFGSFHSYDNMKDGHNNIYNNNINNNLPVYSTNNNNSNSISSVNTSTNTSGNSSCRSSIDESIYNDNNAINNVPNNKNNVNVTISNVNVYNNNKNHRYYNNNQLNVMPEINNNNKNNKNSYDDTNNHTNNGIHFSGVISDNNNYYNEPIYDNNNIYKNNQHNGEHIQQNSFYFPSCNQCCNNGYKNNNFIVSDIDYKQHIPPQQCGQQNGQENNNPFIKNSNIVYPSYKQKYAIQNGSNSFTNETNIKNEIYRHRHDIKNNNNQVQQIKIRGSHFETLVKKLTSYGDNTRCIECNRPFYQKCHLFRHIRDIHLVKTALHSCPFCIKTFHQKSNLDTHCMTHAKDRKFSHPFKCIICIKQGKDKCFTRKSSLKRHCQTKHKNVSIDSEWINSQQTPKWNPILKTFVFNPVKTKVNINKLNKYTNKKL